MARFKDRHEGERTFENVKGKETIDVPVLEIPS
jgi:hypothetical protein